MEKFPLTSNSSLHFMLTSQQFNFRAIDYLKKSLAILISICTAQVTITYVLTRYLSGSVRSVCILYSEVRLCLYVLSNLLRIDFTFVIIRVLLYRCITRWNLTITNILSNITKPLFRFSLHITIYSLGECCHLPRPHKGLKVPFILKTWLLPPIHERSGL